MKKRWSKRRFSRGVAMVEAGILAPIFAMMMMMTVYLGGIYQTKYKSFMESRNKSWTYASNACTNGDGAEDNNEQATPQQNTGNGGQYGNQAQGKADAEQSMFVAHGYDDEQWAYGPTLKFNGGQIKKIRTESWTVCNEPPPQGMNVFAELGNILGGVGL